VLQQTADTRGADAHHRQPARHRLERRQPEGLEGTGRDEQIRARVGAREERAIRLKREHRKHFRSPARRALEPAPQMAFTD